MQANIKKPASPMNPIGQRLKFEMKKRGLSSARLATSAGVKTSFIYDIISGKSANPSTVKLARVADSLGVSLKSLVDTAEMSSGASPTLLASNNDFVILPRLHVDTTREETAVTSIIQENEPYCFRRTWLKQTLNIEPENLRLLSVEGDSMEPNLYHGDLMLIDTGNTTPTPPGLFVIYDGFGLTPKRLELLSHLPQATLRIISDNPQYTIYEKSVDDTRIMGRVAWFARAM